MADDARVPSTDAEVTGLAPPVLTDVLIGFAACLGVEDRNAVYVSTPITTGPRFVDWYPQQHDAGSKAYARRLREQIIGPNIRRARPLVLAARERWLPRPVIDPTALEDVSGWAQHDYHAFWTELIRRCAKTVVFAEGWEFSSGCALEFAAACLAGAEVLDHQFLRIRPEDGQRRLRRAAEKLELVGVDASTLRTALDLCPSAEHELLAGSSGR